MPDETPASQSSSLTSEPAISGGRSLLLSDHEEDSARSAHPFLLETSPLAGLPMQLDVTIPIPSFRVQDLLALERDVVLESRWPHNDDVPVWCGGSQLVWSEFEVVDEKLAVRVTRLS